MKKCRRTIHAALVVGLLVAALPVVAQPSTHDGQTAFGIFAKIEALVAKLWPFTIRPIGPAGDPVGATSKPRPNVEPIDATGKIGADISEGGVAVPADTTNPPGSDYPPGHQGG